MPNSSTSSSNTPHVASTERVTRREVGRIVLFLLGAVLLDRCLGFALAHFQSRIRTGELGRVTQLLDHSNADVVIFGSSRAKHHLDPQLLGTALNRVVFNAAWDGQGIFYHRFLQSELFRNGTRAKSFILQLDPSDLAVSNKSRLVSAMSPWMGNSDETRELVLRCDDRAFVKEHSSCWRFNSLIGPLAWNLLHPTPADDGFSPLSASGRKLVAEPDRALPRFKPDPEIIAEYTRFIAEARARGIEVVLMTCPRLDRNDESEAETKPALHQLARDTAVPLIELDEQRCPQFQSTDLYCDAGHLNRAGATALTQRFAEVIKATPKPLPSAIRLVGGTDESRSQ